MAKINIIQGISNTYKTYNSSGTIKKALKKIAPELKIENCILLNSGEKIDSNYILKKDDVIFVKETPHGVEVVLAWIGVICAIGALGAGIYSAYESYQQQKEMEKAQKESNALAEKNNSMPFLRGSKNKKALGYNIPFIMGRMHHTPYLLTDALYTLGEKDYVQNDIDNGADYTRTFQSYSAKKKQFWNTLLVTGFNDIEIENVSIGTTNILRGNVEIQDDNGETITVVQKDIGVQDFEQGIYYNDENKIEIRDTGAMSFDGMDVKVTSNSIGMEIKHPFGEDAEPVIKQLEPNTYKAVVGIHFDGLRYYDDGWQKRTVEFEMFWTNNPSALTPVWNEAGTITFSDETKNTIRKEFVFDFQAHQCVGKDISIKIVRKTPECEKNGVETAILTYINCFQYDVNETTENQIVPCKPLSNPWQDKTNRIALRILADNTTKDVLDEINVDVYGKARVWNGAQWTTDKKTTRNPASWILEILTSDVHSHSKFQNSEIDLNSLGLLYEYCKEQKFYCDGIVTQDTKKSDLLSRILIECNSTMYLDNNGKWAFATEKAQQYPVALLNEQSIKSVSVAKSFARKPYAHKVNYVNRQNWTVDCAYFDKDGETKANVIYDKNKVIQETTVSYITDYKHAFKYARHLMAKQQLQPREVTVKVGFEGDYYPLYSLVLLQSRQLKIGLSNGIVKGYGTNSNNEITTITTSDLCDFTDKSKKYGIIIQPTELNSTHLFLKVTGSGRTNLLHVETENTLEQPITNAVYSFGYLTENGSFETITNKMMITETKPSVDGWELVLKDYSDELFNYGKIPEYKSNVTIKKEEVLPKQEIKITDIKQTIIDNILEVPEVKSIDSVTYKYLISDKDSGVTDKTVGWSDTPQKVTAEKPYLWCYSIINYSDNTNEQTACVIIGTNGQKGDTGAQGPQGEQGQKGEQGIQGIPGANFHYNLIPGSKLNISSTGIYGVPGTFKSIKVQAGKTYTLSANGRISAKPLTNSSLNVYIFKNDWSWSQGLVINNTVDTTKSFTFTIPSNIDVSDMRVQAYNYPSSDYNDKTVYLNWYKLEEGSVATEWNRTEEEYKGDNGLSALTVKRNFTSTYDVGNTSNLAVTEFSRTPIVNDTFTVVDGSSRLGVWQITSVSNGQAYFKCLSWTNTKGDTGARSTLQFKGREIFRILDGDNAFTLTSATTGIVDNIIVGDTYLNSDTLDLWTCTVAGTKTTAKWRYTQRTKTDKDDTNLLRALNPDNIIYTKSIANTTVTKATTTNPYGKIGDVIRFTTNGAVYAKDSARPWNQRIKIDPNKTYRYSICFKESSYDYHNSYFGVTGWEATNSYTQENGNNHVGGSYFIEKDKIQNKKLNNWYLIVGYVTANNNRTLPSDYGVYDCVTKQKMNTGSDFRNFNWRADVTTVPIGNGTLLNYALTTSLTTTTDICNFRFDEVNGKEPSLYELLYGVTSNPGSRYYGALTSAPASPVEGDYYLDITSKIIKYYTTSWQTDSDYNSWRYNQAMNDIVALTSKTTGLIDAETRWYKNLFANNAIIKNLFSKQIKIQDEGYIASQSPSTGFKINANGTADFKGQLKADNLKVTGTITDSENNGYTIDNAGRANFKNIELSQKAFVTGSIESSNYVAQKSGFMIDGQSGNIEINNGTFNGWLNQGCKFFVGTRIKGRYWANNPSTADNKYIFNSFNPEFKVSYINTGRFAIEIPEKYLEYNIPVIITNYVSDTNLSNNLEQDGIKNINSWSDISNSPNLGRMGSDAYYTSLGRLHGMFKLNGKTYAVICFTDNNNDMWVTPYFFDIALLFISPLNDFYDKFQKSIMVKCLFNVDLTYHSVYYETYDDCSYLETRQLVVDCTSARISNIKVSFYQENSTAIIAQQLGLKKLVVDSITVQGRVDFFNEWGPSVSPWHSINETIPINKDCTTTNSTSATTANIKLSGVTLPKNVVNGSCDTRYGTANQGGTIIVHIQKILINYSVTKSNGQVTKFSVVQNGLEYYGKYKNSYGKNETLTLSKWQDITTKDIDFIY